MSLLADQLALICAALLVTLLLVVTMNRYHLSKLARTAMIASSFGLYLCSKFAAHVDALPDRLTIFGVSVVMMSLAFSSWKEREKL